MGIGAENLGLPGGWDKPIPEVIHLWRHRTSMPNNLEKSRLVCVLDIFCTFLGKNEKNNQSPHWGRDSGIRSSCPRFETSTTRQASSWIANLGHSDGISSSLPQCGVRFLINLIEYSWAGLFCRSFISKIEVPRDVRNSKSENMTSSGKNGINVRTNANPKWDRTRYPEE